MTKFKNIPKTSGESVYDYMKNSTIDVVINKKEPLNMRSVVMEVISNSKLKTTDDKKRYLRKYPHIEHDYPSFYKLIINHDLQDQNIPEVRILYVMLQKSQEINDNKITKNEGEEVVGRLLMNSIIKPNLNNK